MKKGFSQAVFKYIGLILIVLMFISILKNIKKVIAIRSEVGKQKIRVEKIEAENNRIENEIKKAKSPEFMEKQARDKLGLAKEGEVIVVLPDIEEVKKLAPKFDYDEDYLPDPNWKKWLMLFI